MPLKPVKSKERIKKFESIYKEPLRAYDHARKYNSRWSIAEPYIMQDAVYAYKYARDIIKGRWPEAEEYIKNNPEYAAYYAVHILHHKWPVAEPTIKKSQGSWNYYVKYLKNS